jgi:crotonobetainyl-CoA:carnitine CoA-transferase CaiB-like acyl-CoA transferase
MGVTHPKGGLLNSVRVLDLADEKASFCSKVLADMGASVVKVERPGGDPSRKIGPWYEDASASGTGLFFQYHNTNKRGITLDLARGEGRSLFLRLLARYDVLVETFPPGHMEELGLSYGVLKERTPGLIMASVTGFGQHGPRSNYTSCDLVASAFGGQMYVTGSPSMPPLKPFGEQSYYTASLFAAVGILLAVRRRRMTGKGEQVDISLQEAVASTLDHVMIRFLYEKVVPRRQGSLHWNNGFAIVPCKDGHLLITLFQQWDTLVEWMESEGMAEDLAGDEWKDEGYRRSHVDHILAVVERWTKAHTTEELFELAQLMRFPWARIQSPHEVLENPQLAARNFFRDLDCPTQEGSLRYPGAPYQFNLSECGHMRRAPLIGEHNMEIYRSELGLTDEEMEELSRAGVI